VVGALIRVGELECAVADSGTIPADPYMKVTDSLAASLVAREFAGQGITFDPKALCNVLSATSGPDEVEVARAEGFAYYGLHPLAYAEAAAKIQALPPPVLVVGIRSIGTTLSAVAAAALRFSGRNAERITVRPIGHPYNRETRLLPAEYGIVRRHLAGNGAFIVVDEGPGLSGSSFLSVAEALVAAGAQAADILLMCGHQPDLDSLAGADSPRRARKFRWHAVSSQPRRPAGADVFVGGGEWRRLAFAGSGAWPASWTHFERLKYLSSPRDAPLMLFKFAGLGHYGQQVLRREQQIALAGFGPTPQEESDGYASYRWIEARPMTADDLSWDMIEHLASYCAFRADGFPAECAGLNGIEEMAQHNMHQLGLKAAVSLRLERPVLADGRMHPQEWLLAAENRVVKADSGSHGDDHFFPGVTDIGWDLAGAIVEWKMNTAAADVFLECYRRASGDDIAARIPDFITTYAAFRSAYCTMAAHALQGSGEQKLMERAAAEYRSVLRNP
jgi:hypothetical protein